MCPHGVREGVVADEGHRAGDEHEQHHGLVDGHVALEAAAAHAAAALHQLLLRLLARLREHQLVRVQAIAAAAPTTPAATDIRAVAPTRVIRVALLLRLLVLPAAATATTTASSSSGGGAGVEPEVRQAAQQLGPRARVRAQRRLRVELQRPVALVRLGPVERNVQWHRHSQRASRDRRGAAD